MYNHIMNFFKERKKLKLERMEKEKALREEYEREQERIRAEREQEAERKRLAEEAREHERLRIGSIVEEFFSDELQDVIDKTSNLDYPSRLDILERSINKALYDNYLSEEEEKRISDFMDHYQISTVQLPRKSLTRLTQGAVLRDLFDGTVNPRVEVSDLPFNLMKKEVLIWVFYPVNLSEIKTVKGWVGANSGASFRVMKGVYWRVGATKGKRIESQELQNIGHGVVAVTNYYVYFKAGNRDAMRIKLDKIVSVEADFHNVVIFREGARSNPICVGTEDTWFLANVIQNASNWQ